jgi:predicted Rossmann fold nucleotide-binding protein DprA/Smf involved in DNA uptake
VNEELQRRVGGLRAERQTLRHRLRDIDRLLWFYEAVLAGRAGAQLAEASTAEQVADVILRNPDLALTPTEIQGLLRRQGTPINTVISTLRKLMADGVVARVGRGRYTAAQHESPPDRRQL